MKKNTVLNVIHFLGTGTGINSWDAIVILLATKTQNTPNRNQSW